jgi:hypothetical protein
VKKLLKRMMFACAPKWSTAVMSARSRAHSHEVIKGWGVPRINEALIARLGDTVQDGPFRGVALSPMTRAEHLGPYLLGVYESELDPAWDIVLRGRYAQIVDVGAKFGYYAVGLAKRFPQARVVAFDTDWWARKAVDEMVCLNQVPNIEVRGFCDAAWLDRELGAGAFIISDCEGYEGELFCQAPIAQLATAALIIETHDEFVPGVTQRLRDRFAPTHVVRDFGDRSPRRTTSCDLQFLDERQKTLAVRDGRETASWLLCLPRAGPNAPLASIS